MLQFDLPDLVVQRASRNGSVGLRWLTELPQVVGELSDRWGLVLGAAYVAGTSGFVVAATDATNRACVLKMAMPLDRMWQTLGEPCERAVIDRALVLCDRRADAFNPERAVLVHGDAHGWNTLDAGGGTYKFVDVEGLCSEREHDLAVAMREYNEPLLDGDTPRLVRDRARLLADRCTVDPEVVWE